jgi:putative transposase
MLVPMTGRTIHDDELHAHFVTFSCYRKRRLLDHDRAKRVVLGVLGAQLAGRKASCVGFVVMPDHVHAIVWFPIPGPLSVFMQQCTRTPCEPASSHSRAIGHSVPRVITSKGRAWACRFVGSNDASCAWRHPDSRAIGATRGPTPDCQTTGSDHSPRSHSARISI